MKTLLICSGHPILIAGTRAVIAPAGEFSVSVCKEIRDVLPAVPRDGNAVVLVDMALGFPLEMLEEIRHASPQAAIILWMDEVRTEFISQAISLGVMGVLRKNSTPEIYQECLRQVAEGELWLENDLSKRLLRTRTIQLTPRERQLMEMLSQGLRNKEIAFRLGITEGTVKVYLSRLYEKVGAGDRFELALLALKNMATNQVDATPGPLGHSSPGALRHLMPVSVCFEKMAGHIH